MAHGDGKALDKVKTLAEGFGELHSSPYRPRLFVVLDSKHSAKKSRFCDLGVQQDNIQVWKNNGIEYYYPKKHVATSFMCDEWELQGADLGAEPITVKSITMSKVELANRIVPKVTLEDQLDPEILEFLAKLKRATV